MIGQKQIIENINNLIQNDKYPKFTIIIGREGFGKKTLARYIGKKLKYDALFFENKIDDIRSSIDIALRHNGNLLFIFKDAEGMSIQAKNALLKLVEEPPANIRVILLSTAKEHLLPTILSRGHLIDLYYYTREELLEYCETKNIQGEYASKLLEVSNSPGEINQAIDNNIDDIIELSHKIVNNIHVVSLPNLLKIVKDLKYKETDKGHDFNIFLNSLRNAVKNFIVNNNLDYENTFRYTKILEYIAESSNALNYKQSNKRYIIDKLFIDIYTIWGG